MTGNKLMKGGQAILWLLTVSMTPV